MLKLIKTLLISFVLLTNVIAQPYQIKSKEGEICGGGIYVSP